MNEAFREDSALVISRIDHGQWAELFDDLPDMVPSSMHLYDTDRVLMRGGDFEREEGPFLMDDTGAVTYLTNVSPADQRVATRDRNNNTHR